jgi:hypothetical protein
MTHHEKNRRRRASLDRGHDLKASLWWRDVFCRLDDHRYAGQ